MQTKNEFLAAFERKPVEIEADGRKVHIRPLSPADFRAVTDLADAAAKSALALVRSVCDLAGNRLFADEDAASINDLIPNAAGEEIFLEIAKLNRIGEFAKKAPLPVTTN